ncbi:class I mannose-6-phosphate isomerase [Qipengyuania pelagi]|uniref:Mannose-6-phosphate isomerase n=1 Tax=Qipengyuania pelagi TaxID=994320 RepID=A0A844Y928_9SPHN|nr:class I mannose-6-phosphate isomerase [Qipengyuania pelagi]MXO54625.1 mannose-6-phosphate isomerase [Qipengyuania pelagi]
MSARLTTRTVEKPWGVDDLPEPFVTPEGKRIGEIWFEPPAALKDLLVKYLFASENLSVQVHPDDAQALAATGRREGKEECWLITACEPGARIGIGFEAPLDAETLKSAALDGSIEARMAWFDVEPGDFFYIPANTVHAIGAGCSLIEIQQNSDITYRLYDYGRPRELHLDEAVAVAKGEPHPAGLRRRVAETGEITLVEGPLFRLDRLDGAASPEVKARYEGAFLVIPVSGSATIEGETVAAGQCALVGDWSSLSIGDDAKILITQPVL